MASEARLRVAHIITQLELGGAQRNTLYTVTHLDPARYDVALICGPGGILDEEARRTGLPLFFIRNLILPIRPWKDIKVESRCGVVAVDLACRFTAPFVWRRLTIPSLAPFPHPTHRTGRGDLPHPPLGQGMMPSR